MMSATTADKDAIEKLFRRPIRRINIVAGMVVAAIAITMTDRGNVANALFVARSVPIIPPSVTMTMEPVVDIS